MPFSKAQPDIKPSNGALTGRDKLKWIWSSCHLFCFGPPHRASTDEQVESPRKTLLEDTFDGPRQENDLSLSADSLLYRAPRYETQTAHPAGHAAMTNLHLPCSLGSMSDGATHHDQSTFSSQHRQIMVTNVQNVKAAAATAIDQNSNYFFKSQGADSFSCSLESIDSLDDSHWNLDEDTPIFSSSMEESIVRLAVSEFFQEHVSFLRMQTQPRQVELVWHDSSS